jgi:hypothetical protein
MYWPMMWRIARAVLKLARKKYLLSNTNCGTPLLRAIMQKSLYCAHCADTPFGAMILAVACGTLLLFAATRH